MAKGGGNIKKVIMEAMVTGKNLEKKREER